MKLKALFLALFAIFFAASLTYAEDNPRNQWTPWKRIYPGGDSVFGNNFPGIDVRFISKYVLTDTDNVETVKVQLRNGWDTPVTLTCGWTDEKGYARTRDYTIPAGGIAGGPYLYIPWSSASGVTINKCSRMQ